MLFQQLLASGGTSRLAGCALHNPFWRFEQDRSNRDSHPGDDSASDLGFDLGGALKQMFIFHFRNQDHVLGPEIGIVHAHRNDAAVMNGGMFGDNLLNILGIDVLTANDEQVLLSSDHIELTVDTKTEIAGAIPTILDRLSAPILGSLSLWLRGTGEECGVRHQSRRPEAECGGRCVLRNGELRLWKFSEFRAQAIFFW